MSAMVAEGGFVHVMSLDEIQKTACKVVHVNGHTVALWYVGGRVFAVDNRCPHMGFPLERGTVNSGILTCHWHHARFAPQNEYMKY